MTARINVSSSDGIVRTTICGNLTIDDGFQALQLAIEHAADVHYCHLLDLRQARPAGVLAWSCQRLPASLSQRCRRRRSLALLCASSEQRSRSLTSAAARAGFRARAFHDEIDALTWLHAAQRGRRRRGERPAQMV